MNPTVDQWKFMDAVLSRAIYDLYKSGDSDVAIALRILRTKAMYGGVCFRWGDSDKQRHEFEEIEKKWIVALMEEGMKWKSAFGMCPYRESTTNEGVPSIDVPPFGDGKFMWTQTKDDQRKLIVAWQTTKGAETNPLIPDTHVFVWPRHQPDVWSLAPFNSSGARLLRLFLQKEELIANSLDGDFSATHPPVLTQHTDRKPIGHEQYDQEIFADVLARGDAGESPESRQQYRINRETVGRQHKHAAQVNAGVGIVSRLGIGMGGHFIHTHRFHNFQQVMEPLPVGQEPARYQMPQIRGDLMHWIELWKMAVYGEIGIPSTYVAHQRDGRRGGSSRNIDESEASNFQAAISDARGDMALFFETAYRTLRGPDQEKELMAEIAQLGKEEDGEASLRERFRKHMDEARNIEQIQDEAEKRRLAGARSRRESGLRKRLAQVLSVNTDALFRVIQPERIGEMLRDKKDGRQKRLGTLESVIEQQTRLRIVWGPAPILNWQFVVKFTEMGLIEEDTVRKMVLAFLGLPEECNPAAAAAAEGSASGPENKPASKKKRKRNENIRSKGDKRDRPRRPITKKRKTNAAAQKKP